MRVGTIRAVVAALVLAAAVVLDGTVPAGACSMPAPAPLADRATTATVAFAGRIDPRSVVTDEVDGFGRVITAEVVVTLAFRGDVTRRMKVALRAGDGASCGWSAPPTDERLWLATGFGADGSVTGPLRSGVDRATPAAVQEATLVLGIPQAGADLPAAVAPTASRRARWPMVVLACGGGLAVAAACWVVVRRRVAGTGPTAPGSTVTARPPRRW